MGAVRTRAGTFFKNILAPVWDFVYPPVCLTCDALLDIEGVKVCPQCWNSIPCLTEGEGVWAELRQDLCGDGLVSDIYSRYLFQKEGVLHQVVHHLKYRGMRSLGRLLGKEVGKELLARPDFLAADALIPIPLHNTKRRERGYNQAEEVSLGISAVTKIPVWRSVLVRSCYTESQTGLDRDHRMENVRGAFVIHPGAKGSVEGRTIILVDDVITTGSTILACAAELKLSGADKVLAVSAAIAS